jgi:pimeloyl-ACP methyl ester carboxylesterase
MLAHVDVSALFLFCPALYASEALDVPFTSEFSEIIRREKSYESQIATGNLEKFRGDVTIFIGSEDKVIPDRVIEIYADSCRSARSFRLIRLDGAHHVLHAWAADKPDRAARIFGPVSEVVRDSNAANCLR